MARVLLVYHDTNVADIEADELLRAGYEVDRCAGPIGGGSCPVLQGEPCWQVEDADVLVYDTWDSGHGESDLVADLQRLHPDKPLVLTSSGPVVDGRQTSVAGQRPTLFHAPTRASLAGTVERALRSPKPLMSEIAAGRAAEREAHSYHGPRW